MIARARVAPSLSLGVLILTMLAIPDQRARGQAVERGQWENILKLVSADVEKNFYDPRLKGLDWAALTEETRKRINTLDDTGQMILAVSALLSQLQDSHTYFVPPRLTAQADFGFKARAYGNDVRVYEIKKKGPAEKAGLRVGHAILVLNGVPLDRHNLREVLRLVTRVVPARTLELQVAFPGEPPGTVRIPARLITTQEYQYLGSVWRVVDEQRARDVHVNFSHKEHGNGVLYVSIPTFTASPDVTYSVISRARPAKALILDLRGNAGGWMETTLTFLGFFSDKPELLARRVSRTGSQDLTIKPRNPGFQGSIIVLVDSDTASAAELVSRYLQFSHKAVVLGDVTRGMVSEGQIIEGKIGARFVTYFATVVTSATLVMPDGEELEGRGVIPNVHCIPSAEDLVRGADPCLDKATALATGK
ncbi:MAG: S41 family peptidase [Terriglobales bacterium]